MLFDRKPEYAGFWIRFVAVVIDRIVMVAIGLGLEILYSGSLDVFPPPDRGIWYAVLDSVVNAVYVILFWAYLQATPGKLVVRIKIVDAKTGGKPSVWRFIGRYFAYIPSAIPLGAGFIWAAFDSRKQGWHDKLAGTLVVRTSHAPRVSGVPPSAPRGTAPAPPDVPVLPSGTGTQP